MGRWLLPVIVGGLLMGCESTDTPTDAAPDANRDVPTWTDLAEPDADPGLPVDAGRDPGSSNDPGAPDPGGPDLLPDSGGGQDPGPGEGQVSCPQSVGGSACHEIAACAIQCDEPAFQTACAIDPLPTALESWESLRACIARASCDPVFRNEQYTDCVITNCRAELTACSPSPGGSCRDIWKCRKDCDPDDAACPARCFGLGTPEAQDIWIAYKDCILGIECAATDINANGWLTWTCERYGQNHNCPIQAQACFPPTT